VGATQGRAEHAHRASASRSGAATVGLGAMGLRPRASVLHGECGGHEPQLGGAPTTTVASGGPQ
jgi:hypothetical protein